MEVSVIVVPVAVFAVVVAIFSIVLAVARNYKKVPPNEVAVVSGRRNKETGKGYRVVTGGGFFKIPLFEDVKHIKLNVITLPVSVRDVPDKNGALVTVNSIANVKVKSDWESLALAIERFLGYTEQEIKQVAQENLEGNLRAIVGTMTIDELISDRQKLQENIMKEAVTDLAKMGLGIDLLNVQEISDSRGYIDALGMKRTAEVKRDAEIGSAAAERDSAMKSAEYRREAAVATAEAMQATSDAERERDMVVAQNEARVGAERARITVASQIATEEENKRLNVASVAAEQARVQAQIELQGFERDRRDAELRATTIVTAEREAEARVIRAQAEQDAASRTGEALRIEAEKRGQGERARMENESEGRKKQAEAVESEMRASASGEQAMLEARAAGTRAEMLAEAEGARAKAEAYEALDPTGRILMLMEASPVAIESFGRAMRDFMEPTAQAIGSGLANAKEIRLVDLGGGNGSSNGHHPNGNGSVLNQFANLPVETVFGIVEKLRASGFEPIIRQFAERAGFDLSTMLSEGMHESEMEEFAKDESHVIEVPVAQHSAEEQEPANQV